MSEARAIIAEKVHNIRDILRKYPDKRISELCDAILNRLDALGNEEDDRLYCGLLTEDD